MISKPKLQNSTLLGLSWFCSWPASCFPSQLYLSIRQPLDQATVTGAVMCERHQPVKITESLVARTTEATGAAGKYGSVPRCVLELADRAMRSPVTLARSECERVHWGSSRALAAALFI